MSIEEIKQRLKELRAQLRKDAIDGTYKYMEIRDEFQADLLNMGLCLLWVEDVHDYGIFCNEEY